MSRLIGAQESMEIGDLALDCCTAIRVAHERVPCLQLNRLGNGLYVAVLTQRAHAPRADAAGGAARVSCR